MTRPNSFTIGVMACGKIGLTTLKNIKDSFEVSFILTDRLSQFISEFAKQSGIPVFEDNPREGAATEFIRRLEIKKIDVLVSVNYRFLIDADLIAYPKLMSINVHGSLLPRYRGRAPLIWAIINGETETGITVHCIDEGCDTGDILYQESISIPKDATGGEMVDRLSEIYPEAIKKTLYQLMNGTHEFQPQIEYYATHFERRRPEDGLICWEWRRERVYDWVRALAPPYPGAFTLLNDKKVLITSVCLSSHGFSSSDQNGLVIANDRNKPIVKTSNGALEIISYEGSEPLTINVGDVLG